MIFAALHLSYAFTESASSHLDWLRGDRPQAALDRQSGAKSPQDEQQVI